MRKTIFSAALLLTAQSLTAMDVDRELVILVEARTSGLNDFDLILEGVASSFESQDFFSAVTGGPLGSIASTVVFFNAGNSGEQIALPWMQLTTQQELQDFATAIRGLSQPTGGGNVNYGSAIATAAASFASSGFVGTDSQITLIDDGTGFFAANPNGTQQARDNALASGVDVINAVVFDAAFRETAVQSYYEDNIVSSPGEVTVVSSPQGGPKSPLDLSAIEDAIVASVTDGTIESTAESAIAGIPEPSHMLLLSTGLLMLFARRSR